MALEVVKVSLMAGCLVTCLVIGGLLLRRQGRNHRETLAEIRAAGILARAVAEEGGGLPPAPPVPVQAGARHLRSVRADRGLARLGRVLVAAS